MRSIALLLLAAPIAATQLAGCSSAVPASATPVTPPARSAPTPSAPMPSAVTSPAITPHDLEYRLRIIAADSMMGREAGGRGDYLTAAYIASEFHRLGLEPAGENGTYFQVVPFWRTVVDTEARIVGDGATLALRRDFLPMSIATPVTRLPDTRAYYGGSIADSARWAPADGARGRIVVIDVPRTLAMRRVAVNPRRWPGAAAIAIVNLDRAAPEQVARIMDGTVVRDTTMNPRATPLLWVTRRAARVMLGAPLDSLAPGASGPPLDALFGFTREPVTYPARNVVAILRGSDPKLRGEYVALTAHNDHVGFDHYPVDHDSLRAFDRVIRPMGADSPEREPTAAEWTEIHTILDSLRKAHKPRLDSIRNGADDDGSGTVSILEIAEAMANLPAARRPRRSILFVSHTAEEAGLLGSAWYTDHPTVPIDSIVADIDQDMVGRGLPTDYPRGTAEPPASPTYLEDVGDEKLSKQFAAALEAANAKEPVPFVLDRSYAAPGHPLQYYCRADHYNYARYGIPSVSLSRGEHLDYHQVTDEPQYIDYPDLARVSKMVYDAAMLLADADARPALDVPKPADPHQPCRQ